MTEDDTDPMREAVEGGNVVFLPRSAEYSADRMNETFAVMLVGSKAVILKENPAGNPHERYQFLTKDAFELWFRNRFVEGEDGKPWTWSRRWLSDVRRRQFVGLEFVPDPTGAYEREGYYNLWKGFEFDPAPGSWSLLAEHMLENVCGGRETLFEWVLSWFAHMLQKPTERIGTSLVFRGAQGSGKTVVGQIFGRLIAPHYYLVDDPRYIVGQFNAHMASCLLLQADEGFWAGDKQAEGRLKGLVTSDWQMIEQKGIDAIRLPNYVRLLVTSNEDWVVPSGKDERRFAVIDIKGHRAKDAGYFQAILKQMDDGGYAGLLHDMLAWDLDDVDLRTIPKTGALLEQKLRSLDPIEAWWLDRLMAGEVTRGHAWCDIVPAAHLFNDYCRHAEMIGIRRRSEETVFGMKIRKLMPSVTKVRRAVPMEFGGNPDEVTRVSCYRLPTLAEARTLFDAIVEQPVDWSEEGG